MPRAGATFTNSSRSRQGFNLIMNSDMRLAERGSLLAGTGGAQFLIDRHAGWFQAAGTYTSPQIRASTLPSGFPGKSSILSSFRMVSSDVSANGTFLRRQRIESFRLQQPVIIERVSFGFYLWVSNFQDVTIQLLQPTTGISDDWTSFSVIHEESFSVDVDSTWDFYKIENAQLSNLDGLEYRIVLTNPISTSVTTDSYVTQMSLHSGAVFDRDYSLTNLSFWDEFHDCRRMFQKTYPLDVAPGSNIFDGALRQRALQGGGGNISDGGLQMQYSCAPVMRGVPIGVIYSRVTGATGFMRDDNDNVDRAAIFTKINPWGAIVENNGVGFTSGNRFTAHITLDAEI
jgi:hypothetical protein